MTTEKDIELAQSMKDVLALIRLSSSRYGLAEQVRLFAKEELERNIIKDSSESIDGVYSDDPAHYHLKIRQLIQIQAPWSQLEPYCRRLYDLTCSPKILAYIIEICFFHANTSELGDIISEFSQNYERFFEYVHSPVRAGILARLRGLKIADQLTSALMEFRHEKNIDPLEKFFIFERLVKEKNQDSFPYFEAYHVEFLQLIARVGESLRIKEADIWFLGAEAALLNAHEKHALQYLQKISPSSERYRDALKLARTLANNVELGLQQRLVQTICQTSDPSQQLSLVRSAFKSIKENPQSFDLCAFNAWLADPLPHLVKSSELWRFFAETLLEYCDDAQIFTNILRPFQQALVTWYSPTLNGALWSVFLDTKWANSKYSLYHAAALFQHFLISPASREQNLWHAFLLFKNESRKAVRDFTLTWEKLRSLTLGFIKSSHFQLPPKVADLAYTKLKVACEPPEISAKDIVEYLKICQNAPRWALENLANVMAHSAYLPIELQIKIKLGQIGSYTNVELKKISWLASLCGQQDLSWRALAILASRHALPSEVESAWQICGETQDRFPLLAVDSIEVDSCLLGFTPEQARLVWAILKVGPLLPLLLSQHDDDIEWVTHSIPTMNKTQNNFKILLSDSSVLKPMLGFYRLKKNGQWCSQEHMHPIFVKTVEANTYSNCLFFIHYYLGINSWDGSLSCLADKLSRLNSRSRPMPVTDNSRSTQIGKWLRKLNQEQRSAWHDLNSLLPKLDHEEADTCLAIFCVRLSLLCCQSHYQALSALRQMKVALPIIWGLESFILSPNYSTVRKNRSQCHMMEVPSTILSLLQ